jgi:uncharacterized coiled-coil protein SlyX
MSEQPITVTYSLETVLTRLEQKFDQKFAHLENKINHQSEEIATIKGTLQAQQTFIQTMPDLTEKVGELKNRKQIGLVIVTAGISSVFTGTIGGVIGWLIRGGNFKP